jgi:hypothetical protein
MGAEKDFTTLLRLQIGGEQGTPAGLNWTGGTPNHWALAAATAYAYGLKGNPQQQAAGRQKVLDFFQMQDQAGHMARGRTSEFGTPSHFAWWQAAVAGIWLLSDRAKDQEVLTAARTWWIRELTVENLCATPQGHVVMPGARAAGGGNADQMKQRDVGRKIILNEKVRIPKNLDSLDYTGLWILLQIARAELKTVASAPADLPHPLDTLNILRDDAGHVAWFDEFHGLRPAYWGWADYATEEEKYGTDPSWPKNQPGGKLPDDLPVPELPGGDKGAQRITAQGRLAAAPVQAEDSPAPSAA